MSEPEPDPEPPLPLWVVLPGGALLALLLSIWSAFLVPLRVGTVPLPLWAVLLVGTYALALLCARQVGVVGALVPLAVWAVTAFQLGTATGERDLVVPGTLSGYLYLYGGLLGWVVVALRASAADADRKAEARADRKAATPGAAPRR